VEQAGTGSLSPGRTAARHRRRRAGHHVTRRRESEDLRDAFIGALTHELRTPIASTFGGNVAVTIA